MVATEVTWLDLQGCGLKIENPLTWAWHRVFCCFSIPKRWIQWVKNGHCQQDTKLYTFLLHHWFECTIQLTFNIHSFRISYVFFPYVIFSHLWFNPWHLAKMVPLFIRLAWLVVMVGGEWETSMLQTQMLLKRTPLHPWEVNNYVMVSWRSPKIPGIPTTIKTMGVNITTIVYLRVLIIQIGSTIILMVVEA